MHRRRSRSAAVLGGAVVVAGALTACTPPTTAVAPAVVRTEPTSAVLQRYDLTEFVVPVRVDVAPQLVEQSRSSTLVSWSLASDRDAAVRLMAPTTVRPGSAPQPAPEDYTAYLRGLSGFGMRVREDGPVRIAGTWGHRLLVTAVRPIPAGFGCWSPASADCFSVVPGVALQVVVFALRGRPVLLWARSWGSHPAPGTDAAFERMVAGLRTAGAV